jgi:hypothetical protein
LRAKVREELSIVEQLRWAKGDAPEVQKRADDLAAARLRLHIAAMLAHLPRGLIEEYDHLVLAAHKSSRKSLSAKQVGSVPVVITVCVEAAYELICDQLWHPVLTRLTYRWRFKKLKMLVAKNREVKEGANLRWAYYEA